MSWEETCKVIEEGTVESLALLGRSVDQIAVYRKFMAGVSAGDAGEIATKRPKH